MSFHSGIAMPTGPQPSSQDLSKTRIIFFLPLKRKKKKQTPPKRKGERACPTSQNMHLPAQNSGSVNNWVWENWVTWEFERSSFCLSTDGAFPLNSVTTLSQWNLLSRKAIDVAYCYVIKIPRIPESWPGTDEYHVGGTDVSHTCASHRQMLTGQWLLTQTDVHEEHDVHHKLPQGSLDIKLSVLGCVLSQRCPPQSYRHRRKSRVPNSTSF